MAEPVPILSFEQASLCPPLQSENCLKNVTLRLDPGDCAVVEIVLSQDSKDAGFDYFPLADAAEGLLLCALPGMVKFMGRDWAAMSPIEQARARGRIGRVFDYHGWVHNLTVMENLVLRCRTHHARTVPHPEAEAQQLAIRFGLAGVPEGRPAVVRKRDLRRCEWIRAFLGKPDLVILERPEMDTPRGALDALCDTALEAKERGAAVLWVTHDSEIIERAVKLGAAHYMIRGSNWSRREESGR